jgi:DNA-binding transcriptional LysR family regulator
MVAMGSHVEKARYSHGSHDCSASMERQTIRTFIDVVRQGSFAAAARLRNVDPSSVSRAISSLEAELGFPLLHRTTRTPSLTEAGARNHARVEPMVDDLVRAGEEARDLVSGPAGTLRVCASPSFVEVHGRPDTPGERLDLFPEHECAATSFDTAAWLIYPRRHYRGLKVDAFVRHLRNRFERHAAEP